MRRRFHKSTHSGFRRLSPVRTEQVFYAWQQKAIEQDLAAYGITACSRPRVFHSYAHLAQLLRKERTATTASSHRLCLFSKSSNNQCKQNTRQSYPNRRWLCGQKGLLRGCSFQKLYQDTANRLCRVSEAVLPAMLSFKPGWSVAFVSRFQIAVADRRGLSPCLHSPASASNLPGYFADARVVSLPAELKLNVWWPIIVHTYGSCLLSNSGNETDSPTFSEIFVTS